jgi:hypothetical protein
VRGNPSKKENNILFDNDRAIGRDNLTVSQRIVVRVIVAPLRNDYGYGF